MSRVIIGMTMSLDGYINDAQGDVSRLYPDMEAMRAEIQDEIRTTGAVVMGRRTFDMAGGDYTGYEYQVPIFVVTREPHPESVTGENDALKFHFVPDLADALAQAKAAAGEKHVTVVGGASIIQQLIKLGLFDELRIDVMPVLLCGGTRLFGNLGAQPIDLQSADTTTPRGVTHLVYRPSAQRRKTG